MVELLLITSSIFCLSATIVEPTCLLIENVAIRPERASRSYGHALMRHAAEVARSKDVGRLRLYTNRLMVENITFYQRLGYAIDREETTADGRQIVHMSAAV
jgi:N-acetylglutamate synthase-like GNAT family acetyltransferase